ncbi:MAG: DUF4236 domain-containing protein [Acutalibacteraceae bacterium]
MGFRFRKSINLGGGFKVNLSKSGVGYSFGGKGFRVARTAKGKTRTTASIYGTGLSYSKEFGGSSHKRNSAPHTTPNNPNSVTVADNNYYDTQEIKNANAKNLVSEGLEEMLAAANESLKMYSLALIGFFVSLILGFGFPLFWVATVICAIYGYRVRKNGIIDLEYTFDDEQKALVDERMQPLIKMTNSKKIWWITQTSKVIDKKYSSGASNSVKRKDCKASTKAPFPFQTNSVAVCFKCGKEALLFLPDKLFVFQGMKIGAVNYSDVTTSVHGQRFVESESVPRDAQVVDHTWQYVNKSGGPDKRFQNNRKLPVCLYGEMEVRSASGINTDIMFSNPNIQS